MAKPVTFKNRGSASAFRTALNRAYWRDTDRIRSDTSLFRRNKAPKSRAAGTGGGS